MKWTRAVVLWRCEKPAVRRMIVPRREPRKQDPCSQVLDKVRRMLGSSPLTCICQQVEEVLFPLQRGLVGHNAVDRLSAYIAGMLDLLPQSFGERFRFIPI
jgi:hypothetical protein